MKGSLLDMRDEKEKKKKLKILERMLPALGKFRFAS